MAKAPELKALFDIDQLLRHFVRVPVLLRLVVDELEHLHQLGIALVRLRPVALGAGSWNGQAASRQVAEELIIQGWRFEQRGELDVNGGIVAKDIEQRAMLVAEQKLDGAILRRLKTRGAAQR